MNNEAAQKARESRRAFSNKNEKHIKSTDFEQTLKEQFGRDLNMEDPPDFSTNQGISNRRKMEGIDAKDLQQIEVFRRKRDFKPKE